MANTIDGGVPSQVPFLPESEEGEPSRSWARAQAPAQSTVVPWAPPAVAPNSNDGAWGWPSGGQVAGTDSGTPNDRSGDAGTVSAVSVTQLTAIFPNAQASDVADLARVLNARAADFGLDLSDPVAVAHFLAQVGTETNLHPQRENMNYQTAGRLAACGLAASARTPVSTLAPSFASRRLLGTRSTMVGWGTTLARATISGEAVSSRQRVATATKNCRPRSTRVTSEMLEESTSSRHRIRLTKGIFLS